jgi:hypothetical protein
VHDDGTIFATAPNPATLAADIDLWVDTNQASTGKLNVKYYYDDTKPDAYKCYSLEGWAILQTFIIQAKIG